MSVELDDVQECELCNQPYELRDGDEPTRLCDHCAHDRVDALEKENADLKAKLAQVEADTAAMRVAFADLLEDFENWLTDHDVDLKTQSRLEHSHKALATGSGQALLDELAKLRNENEHLKEVGEADVLTNAVIELRTTAQRRLELLREVEGPVSDVVAFGNCDCDIPNGKTCLVCQLSMLHKALAAELE